MLKITTIHPCEHAARFFLLEAGKTALLDVGQFFAAYEAVSKVKDALNGRKLDYIILTHSHYDHCGPLAYFRKAFPGVVVIGSPKCRDVLDKQSAKEKIAELCYGAAEDLLGTRDTCPPFIYDGFCVDKVVTTGDVLDLDGAKLEFFLSPGHTICSMGMIDREDGILLPSETTGVYQDGTVIDVTPLKGFQMSVDSIDYVLSLDFKKAIIPHHGDLGWEDPKEFFRQARESLFELREIICGCGEKGMSDDEIYDYCKKNIYDARGYAELNLPLTAFSANFHPMIQMFKREFPERFAAQQVNA